MASTSSLRNISSDSDDEVSIVFDSRSPSSPSPVPIFTSEPFHLFHTNLSRFERMPSNLRRLHPEWLCAEYGNITLVINHSFCSFTTGQSTFLRLATRTEMANSDDLTVIYFEPLHRYETYAEASIEEVITHPNLSWIFNGNLPPTMAYSSIPFYHLA